MSTPNKKILKLDVSNIPASFCRLPQAGMVLVSYAGLSLVTDGWSAVTPGLLPDSPIRNASGWQRGRS